MCSLFPLLWAIILKLVIGSAGSGSKKKQIFVRHSSLIDWLRCYSLFICPDKKEMKTNTLARLGLFWNFSSLNMWGTNQNFWYWGPALLCLSQELSRTNGKLCLHFGKWTFSWCAPDPPPKKSTHIGGLHTPTCLRGGKWELISECTLVPGMVGVKGVKEEIVCNVWEESAVRIRPSPLGTKE